MGSALESLLLQPLPPMIGRTIKQYRILEKLGEGGMGVVYKAEDTTLHRTAALKFLPGYGRVDEQGRARLLEEARAAAHLDHPNICTVYEVGEDDGRAFLAMAFVEGQTLAAKVGESPLELPEFLDLAIQLTEGVAAAHEKGVIHHDIKSANVIVTDKGQAKILDFGIAESEAVDSPTITSVAGTAAYMAPEKARQEPSDERSDIWSLGVVFYEMLTGRTPFRGEYEAAILYAVLNEVPTPPSELNSEVPIEVERVVLKALEKAPELRYQHVSELLADLRAIRDQSSAPTWRQVVLRTGRTSPAKRRGRRSWRLTGAVCLLVFAAGLLWWQARGPSSSDRPAVARVGSPDRPRPSIAVLPLEDLAAQLEQDYFADGMTDALITNLAKIEALRVISRTSAMQYKGRQVPLRQIADELDVGYVVEGSVLRDGDRIRINAQLIDTATDRHVWAESYDGDLEDVLALQSDVAMAVAGEIRVQLTPPERLLLSDSRTISVEAYEHYLQGQYWSKRRTKEGLARALEHFHSAIVAEPDSPLAYAGSADALILQANYGHAPPQELWPQAKEAAARAVELDDSLADAHATLGLIRSFYEWDWPRADMEYRRAIDLNPGNATARHRYAVYLSRIGRHGDAIAEIQRARELDPLSLSINNAVGIVYYMARRYDEAIAELIACSELSKAYYRPYWTLGRCYLDQKKFEQGVAALKKARELSGSNPFMVAAQGYGLGRAGDAEHARQVLAELEAIAARRYVSPAGVALVHLGLGQNDVALDWLQKALAERSGQLVWLKVDPMFDPLRSDPRFLELLEAVGLDE